MLFAGKETYIERISACGLENGVSPQTEGHSQDKGHSFANNDRPRVANNMLNFSLVVNWFINGLAYTTLK